MTDNTQHHYFASHALGWATAPTLEEAIEKLWHGRYTDVNKWLLNARKDGSVGLNFFCCRVPLPADANYSIEFYCPKVEGITETANYLLTYYTQKKVVWARDKGDEVRTLKRELDAALAELAGYHASEDDAVARAEAACGA